jgi:hypothetical protein
VRRSEELVKRSYQEAQRREMWFPMPMEHYGELWGMRQRLGGRYGSLGNVVRVLWEHGNKATSEERVWELWEQRLSGMKQRMNKYGWLRGLYKRGT